MGQHIATAAKYVKDNVIDPSTDFFRDDFVDFFENDVHNFVRDKIIDPTKDAFTTAYKKARDEVGDSFVGDIVDWTIDTANAFRQLRNRAPPPDVYAQFRPIPGTANEYDSANAITETEVEEYVEDGERYTITTKVSVYLMPFRLELASNPGYCWGPVYYKEKLQPGIRPCQKSFPWFLNAMNQLSLDATNEACLNVNFETGEFVATKCIMDEGEMAPVFAFFDSGLITFIGEDPDKEGSFIPVKEILVSSHGLLPSDDKPDNIRWGRQFAFSLPIEVLSSDGDGNPVVSINRDGETLYHFLGYKVLKSGEGEPLQGFACDFSEADGDLKTNPCTDCCTMLGYTLNSRGTPRAMDGFSCSFDNIVQPLADNPCTDCCLPRQGVAEDGMTWNCDQQKTCSYVFPDGSSMVCDKNDRCDFGIQTCDVVDGEMLNCVMNPGRHELEDGLVMECDEKGTCVYIFPEGGTMTCDKDDRCDLGLQTCDMVAGEMENCRYNEGEHTLEDGTQVVCDGDENCQYLYPDGFEIACDASNVCKVGVQECDMVDGELQNCRYPVGLQELEGGGTIECDAAQNCTYTFEDGETMECDAQNRCLTGPQICDLVNGELVNCIAADGWVCDEAGCDRGFCDADGTCFFEEGYLCTAEGVCEAQDGYCCGKSGCVKGACNDDNVQVELQQRERASTSIHQQKRFSSDFAIQRKLMQLEELQSAIEEEEDRGISLQQQVIMMLFGLAAAGGVILLR